MTVQRYRRKPDPPRREDQFAARYEPGQPLDDLLAVARMAGSEAEVREVVFPSGKQVLLAWYMRVPDAHLPEPEYVTVEPGDYLAFSRSGWHLYDADDANWRQFYDLLPEEGQ